jgi:hypothetical protein
MNNSVYFNLHCFYLQLYDVMQIKLSKTIIVKYLCLSELQIILDLNYENMLSLQLNSDWTQPGP